MNTPFYSLDKINELARKITADVLKLDLNLEVSGSSVAVVYIPRDPFNMQHITTRLPTVSPTFTISKSDVGLAEIINLDLSDE